VPKVEEKETSAEIANEVAFASEILLPRLNAFTQNPLAIHSRGTSPSLPSPFCPKELNG